MYKPVERYRAIMTLLFFLPVIKTYFIVGYKKKDGAKPDQSVGNTADTVQPDTVAISMEGENGPTESDTLMNDASHEVCDESLSMCSIFHSFLMG